MFVKLIGVSGPTFDHQWGSEEIVWAALSQCYNESFDPFVDQFPTKAAFKAVINSVLESGHTSVSEHVYFTFLICGISRACSHQLVRHRIASYTQQSQRYVKMDSSTPYVIPSSISRNAEALNMFNDLMDHIKDVYQELMEGFNIPAEDARFCLPNACPTNIVVSMNARTLGDFLGKRLCKRAQWEIRAVAKEISEICKEVCPTIFEEAKFGFASCFQNGFCKEKKSCGLIPRLQDLQDAYNKQKEKK